MCVDTHRVGCGNLAVRADNVGTLQFVFREGYGTLDISVDLHIVKSCDLAVAVDIAFRVNLHILCDRCRTDNNLFGACHVVFLGNRHYVGAFGNAVELIYRAVAVNNLGI